MNRTIQLHSPAIARELGLFIDALGNQPESSRSGGWEEAQAIGRVTRAASIVVGVMEGKGVWGSAGPHRSLIQLIVQSAEFTGNEVGVVQKTVGAHDDVNKEAQWCGDGFDARDVLV